MDDEQPPDPDHIEIIEGGREPAAPMPTAAGGAERHGPGLRPVFTRARAVRTALVVAGDPVAARVARGSAKGGWQCSYTGTTC